MTLHRLPRVGGSRSRLFVGNDVQWSTDAEWYKRAVIYQVLVRAFADSNGDGTGDLPGLTGKLDYLAWLGIDCIWIPPIYDSPLRDGGYDVSDYRQILPAYGTMDDFHTFVETAHGQGIRIITDLVMNHTSDQHEWFQQSRQDPHGPFGDFYVWRNHHTGYPDARIILFDTETSNWTFDPIRGQYYWHRFFSHQPDLNLDNAAVVDALMDITRFWLDRGVDGFRLDAVPYLFEREGTDCAHLPETHSFLKRIRKLVDYEYPGRVMLAEANGWPGEVAEYLGDPDTGGDECHMAFHFAVMPQLYAGLARQSRFPISQVLAETTKIPETSQWAVFLRSHDELTLEMVTVEDRQLMYGTYAPEPRMRAYEGIRRRLTPLLGADRTKLELLNALLFSLPGSPVLYYGDEIGMGDNIWLPDRDSVRTPMQWDATANGGFSTCDSAELYLPMIAETDYSYATVNVARQQDVQSSLLHWVRHLIATRKDHPALGLGGFADLGGDNAAVFSFTRELPPAEATTGNSNTETQPSTMPGTNTVLCVYNFSETAQEFELDLDHYIGQTPVVLSQTSSYAGISELSAITETPYRLKLDAHAYCWLDLSVSD